LAVPDRDQRGPAQPRTPPCPTAVGAARRRRGELPDERPSPHERAQAHELRWALERAILDLPLKYRMPLVLRDVEGLSTEQAAAVMGLGEAAFKSRLHRARLAVRAAVEHYVAQGHDT